METGVVTPLGRGESAFNEDGHIRPFPPAHEAGLGGRWRVVLDQPTATGKAGIIERVCPEIVAPDAEGRTSSVRVTVNVSLTREEANA